ncbi:MAG: hypothetical protein SGPRY_004269, partial [Prymnesium sp.]
KRRRCHIKACDKPPPKRGADAVDAASKLREQLGDDDPIFQDELFLSSQQLRYADGRTGGGVGYLASYLPFTAANNHSRAVVCVVTQSDSFSEVALRTLVDRVALSCECVALLPFLRGGAASWPHERLVNEVLDASRYLNRAHRVERLAVLAYGAGSQKTLELLADGGIEAHAAVLLCPGLSAGASRAARVIQTPLLAICTSDAEKEELLQGLRVNSRIARDYFIADFVGREPDFASAPASAPQEEAQRVLALIQSWVDRYGRAERNRDGELHPSRASVLFLLKQGGDPRPSGPRGITERESSNPQGLEHSFSDGR